MKLPSKKIILILGACILAVGSIFFAVRPQGAEKQEDKMKDTYLKAVASNTSELDTDNDGLKDWEELLWQTDPKKEDTDGDGTSDSAEIRQSRDPLRKGPDDKMATSTLAAGLVASASSTEDLTSTEIFARQFFTAYLSMKSQGITMDADAQQKVVDDVLKSGNFPIPKPKIYTSSQINTAGANDVISLHAYANMLGQAMIDRSPKKAYDNEYEVFNNAVIKNDPKELEKMDIIINGYNALLEDYLKMRVPSAALQPHLNLINSISVLLTDLRAMRAFFDDPVAGYSRLGTFPNDVRLFGAAIDNLHDFFIRYNVTFIQSDPAYRLLYGI